MKTKDLLLGVLIMAIWGLNFSVIKLGLESVDPFLLAACRFFLSAIPLVFFVRKPNVSMWVVGIYGLLFGVGLWGIVTLAIQIGVSAGIASLVLQSSAFFTLVLGAYWFGNRLYATHWVGIALAALGLGCLIVLSPGQLPVAGLLLVILGALSWSVSNILVKQHRPVPMFSFLVWSSLFSPVPLVGLAFLTEGYRPFEEFAAQIDGLALFSITFQVYVTTVFGYWAWNGLISRYPLPQVAPLSLLVPIFGLLGSAVIFGEPIGYGKVLSTVLILLGLVIITSAQWISDRLPATRLRM
ncbi:EamA family transporter [Salinisphaera hydrothermalis]|uniref:EamA family transporter n=1 Tax=Salinisphaera hydrothermalis TaxID=563188 RepID=UPI0033417019